jgi:hypothetical protein
MKSEYKTASQSGVVVYFSVFKLIAALTFFLSLNSCLGIAVGAASATVGAGIAVAKVPAKVVGKAAGATLGLILPDGKE